MTPPPLQRERAAPGSLPLNAADVLDDRSTAGGSVTTAGGAAVVNGTKRPTVKKNPQTSTAPSNVPFVSRHTSALPPVQTPVLDSRANLIPTAHNLVNGQMVQLQTTPSLVRSGPLVTTGDLRISPTNIFFTKEHEWHISPPTRISSTIKPPQLSLPIAWCIILKVFSSVFLTKEQVSVKWLLRCCRVDNLPVGNCTKSELVVVLATSLFSRGRISLPVVFERDEVRVTMESIVLNPGVTTAPAIRTASVTAAHMVVEHARPMFECQVVEGGDLTRKHKGE
ncbi:hypothetical protein M427DRAFT_49931 [Gonapodya prolifera JEL478]|uniref:Uncharacterized protein n=1 Tax=Gonapodya prolifera (strain JEL478) TaxID=1344416 RepID=A0A138ZXH4_GONPJ|nr:hypothetical protein M427DRAFT_49931 [Gonapodya prolifera JEL478]|eukprot:KXS09164.1 hypothetical protein M427DRAFT_49931 [Gonapodya prolifera JEL478]